MFIGYLEYVAPLVLLALQRSLHYDRTCTKIPTMNPASVLYPGTE